MTLAIELSSETKARLRALAEAHCLDVEAYAAEIPEEAASPTTPVKGLSAGEKWKPFSRKWPSFAIGSPDCPVKHSPAR
jgi:hypothetical protein